MGGENTGGGRRGLKKAGGTGRREGERDTHTGSIASRCAEGRGRQGGQGNCTDGRFGQYWGVAGCRRKEGEGRGGGEEKQKQHIKRKNGTERSVSLFNWKHLLKWRIRLGVPRPYFPPTERPALNRISSSSLSPPPLLDPALGAGSVPVLSSVSPPGKSEARSVKRRRERERKKKG